MKNIDFLVESRDGADWVTLNRPLRMNAISSGLLNSLHDYLERVRRDQSVRVIVLRGAGRGFCSGIDAKDFADPETPDFESWKIGDVVRLIHEAPQPVIALINGPALGAGFAYAAAADVRIAAASAWMRANFTDLGIGGAELGLSYFLPATVGRSVARELLLTSRRFSAERALATGFVSEVVANDVLDQAGERMVADMLALSPMGLRVTKQTMNSSRFDGNIEAVVEWERRGQHLCFRGDIGDRFGAIAERLAERKSQAQS